MPLATPLSRREFAALAAAAPLALGPRPFRLDGLSALEVIERIKKNLGVEWKPDTVDAVKAGDPATMVTGIVTTSMATVSVLQRAAKAGANLVITCEPTFYSRSDARELAAGRVGGPEGGGPAATGASRPAPVAPRPDPVLAAKNDLIAQNRIVVFRLRDHWRLRRPDPLVQGLGDALGWPAYSVAGDPSQYDIPALTLAALVDHTKKRLRARGGIRVIGDPRIRVQKVALLPGSTPLAASLAALPRVDVIVAGEVREWESVEYARDAVHSGQRKGLILVGRILSEEPGMQMCADWLRTLLPGVPVRHVAAGDPYWRPS